MDSQPKPSMRLWEVALLLTAVSVVIASDFVDFSDLYNQAMGKPTKEQIAQEHLKARVEKDAVKDARFAVWEEENRKLPQGAVAAAASSVQDVEKFIKTVAPEVLTFGFSDYEARQRQAAGYFTRRGFEGFYTALERSGVVRSVKDKEMTLSAMVPCVTAIESSLDKASNKTWTAHFPIGMLYLRDVHQKKVWHLVKAVVMQKTDESADHAAGLGIRQWSAQLLGDDNDALALCKE